MFADLSPCENRGGMATGALWGGVEYIGACDGPAPPWCPWWASMVRAASSMSATGRLSMSCAVIGSASCPVGDVTRTSGVGVLEGESLKFNLLARANARSRTSDGTLLVIACARSSTSWSEWAATLSCSAISLLSLRALSSSGDVSVGELSSMSGVRSSHPSSARSTESIFMTSTWCPCPGSGSRLSASASIAGRSTSIQPLPMSVNVAYWPIVMNWS